MKTLLALLGLLIACETAVADEVDLVTDKPIYRAGVPGGVTIAVRNNLGETVKLPNSAPWEIWGESGLVYTPPSSSAFVSVPPGASKTWTWDKKGANGNFVGAGTYTIEFGPILFEVESEEEDDDSGPLILIRDIALTKTGILADNSWFPLAVGNEWDLLGGPKAIQAKVGFKGQGGWYKVSSPIANKPLWMKLVMAPQPTLKASPKANQGVGDLFQFHRPVGHSYKVNYSSIGSRMVNKTLRVGAVNQAVDTPAGRFTGCYRLDVLPAAKKYKEFGSFWFARGVGWVRYTAIGYDGKLVAYSLHRAKIQDTDGTWYTIGIE